MEETLAPGPICMTNLIHCVGRDTLIFSSRDVERDCMYMYA